MNKLFLKKTQLSYISIILIMIGEICFFKAESIYLYRFLTIMGMSLVIVGNLKKFKIDSFIIWITILYLVYFIYGFFFLQKGDFPWDTIGYRYIEGICLYLSISYLLLIDKNKLEKAFLLVGVFSTCYLLFFESNNIMSGNMRIGDSLSGNVNTVGYNFGIISTIMMWYYCQQKRNYQIIWFSFFSLIMLITGSKKIFIILGMNLLMLFWYERKKMNGWIKGIILFFVTVYLVFYVPYFYNIIGIRIESMIDTLIYGTASLEYSYSTEVRDEMIKEAFHFFLNNPIFGNGWNYFYAHTMYGYEYSHCNYTELLCSFGILGTLLFYSKYFSNLFVMIKNIHNKFIHKDLLVLIFILTVEALLLDWAAVTFSAQCIWYLPVIIASSSASVLSKLNGRKT